MKDLGLITALALATLAARLLPTAAVLACLAVALTVGAMAWAWTYLTAPPAPSTPTVPSAPFAAATSASGWPFRGHTAVPPPARGARPAPLGSAVRAGLLGGAAAIGLAEFVVTFGPASVSVLTAAYGVAAMTRWLTHAH